jgi:DNA-binding FadR family transcriptional regulator
LASITLDQLFEVRMELGLIILKYFYRRANTTDIKRLEKCIDEAENLFKRGAQPREKFIEFHRLITQGSKNPVFLLLYNSLLDILLKKFLSKFTSCPEHSKKFLAYNKKILDSFREGDMDKASITLKKYLAYLKKITEARTGLLGQVSDRFGPADSMES